jgi:hypothetical protein
MSAKTRQVPITVHLTMTGSECGSEIMRCAMYAASDESEWCQLYDQSVWYAGIPGKRQRCLACLATHPEPDPDTIVRSES